MTQEIITWTKMTNLFNHDLLSASEILKNFQNWIIFAHKKIDGDAAGSVSALFTIGQNLGKNVKWLGSDKDLPLSYKFLVNSDKYISCESLNFNEPETLYIFLDCTNESRPSIEGFSRGENINSLNIDHHEDNNFFAQVNCVDGKASSTCEMLYRVFKAGDWQITREIAESLYTGLFTDTGGFIFSNTHSESHLMASDLLSLGVDPSRISDLILKNKTPENFKLWARAFERVKILDKIFAVSYLLASDFRETGADLSDTTGLPATLMTLRDVKFAVMIHEDINKIVHASFRSCEGSPFNAGEVARLFGGGGHERAAGATLDGSLSEVIDKIENFLTCKYHECSCINK
ncbi:MAG: bifunctional oligoribonuclease/PAP phosphatase NrnA [Synergistaceae bacterium]|nr:bifunctional oligoribonuclease/PAP phosphatase NrnA [Synergistaceae bacterium]